MKKIPAKTADALDLIIELATLGEYGLEYPERSTDRAENPCTGGRQRPGTPVARSSTVGPRPSGRFAPGSTPSAAERLRSRPESPACIAGNPEFASALRPPRIKLSFTE